MNLATIATTMSRVPGSAAAKHKMSSQRKTSLVAGLFYLITFISIPTIGLYASVHGSNYIAGHGSDTAVIIGAVLELIVGLAGIGTAVALFPVVKRQNEGLALGFVTTRVLEATGIFVGVAAILSLVTLRQAGVGADGLVAGHVLVALYDRMFLVTQSFMPVLNALLLGTLMYKSRLVPRIIPLLGLIGAPILITADAAVLFGLLGSHAPVLGLATLPDFVWELSLGLWLTFKGFKPSAVTALATRSSGAE
jgi:hypothetical protein